MVNHFNSLVVLLVSHGHQRVVHFQHLLSGQVSDVEFEFHHGCVVLTVRLLTVPNVVDTSTISNATTDTVGICDLL